MDELISVIVPIYKVEKYISKCIESIQNQTYKNLEIILVDDESPDNCGKICDEYAKKDARIKVIHKKNGGLSDARNAGIDIARGKYIAFVDSDDYVQNRYIETLYSLCKENNTDISECDYLEFSNENFEEIKEEIKTQTLDKMQALLSKDHQSIAINIAWNKLYKKELFEGIRYPKGKIHEDEATTYKLIYKAGKITITNEKLYYYRQHKDSIMQKKYNIKRLDYIEALEGRLEFYKNKNEQELYNYTLKSYCGNLRNSYCLVNKYVENSKEILEELSSKFKKVYKELKESKQIKIQDILFITFPIIYEKIFWFKGE